MSGKMSRTRQVESLGDLSILAEMLKNPQSIIDANELARKENALTEVEKAKIDECRNIIKTADAIIAEQKRQQNIFDNEKAKWEQRISEFQVNTAQVQQSYVDREKAISEKEKILFQKENDLKKASTDLDIIVKENNDTYDKKIKEAKKLIDFNADYKKVLDDKNNTLLAYEQRLKSKAQVLKQTADEI